LRSMLFGRDVPRREATHRYLLVEMALVIEDNAEIV